MATESITVRAVIPATADRVYAAWLDGKEHGKMTGAPASVDEHTACDGYIRGTILELEPSRRIVQSWRSTDFPLGHADSRLEVHLRDVDGSCELTIVHAEIPVGQGTMYESGWRDHYVQPMLRYFGEAAKPARRRPAAKKKKVARKAATKTKAKPKVKNAKKAKRAKRR